MSALNVALPIAGASMLALSAVHACFANLFNWREDTKNLTAINRQIFWAHTAFLTGGIALLGGCCLFFPSALIERTRLGAVAAACFTLCWLSRLIWQFLVFKGIFAEDKNLNAALHVTGSLTWIFYTALFAVLFFYQIGALS